MYLYRHVYLPLSPSGRLVSIRIVHLSATRRPSHRLCFRRFRMDARYLRRRIAIFPISGFVEKYRRNQDGEKTLGLNLTLYLKTRKSFHSLLVVSLAAIVTRCSDLFWLFSGAFPRKTAVFRASFLFAVRNDPKGKGKACASSWVLNGGGSIKNVASNIGR